MNLKSQICKINESINALEQIRDAMVLDFATADKDDAIFWRNLAREIGKFYALRAYHKKYGGKLLRNKLWFDKIEKM